MLRTIKSYVRRQGRMTPRQEHALEHHSAQYGLTLPQEGTFNWVEIFKRDRPLVLEIGFGMGHSLIDMATRQPEFNFVGVEVHRPGVGSALAELVDHGLQNLRLIEGDAVTILNTAITDESLSKIQIFFPDPWPKKRHHKRRLIQNEFVELLVKKLRPQGQIHLATDWEPYAVWMMDVLSSIPRLKNTAGDGAYLEKQTDRPLTKFERRGLGLGHQIWDLLFIKSQ